MESNTVETLLVEIFNDLTSTERGNLTFLFKVPLAKENPVEQIHILYRMELLPKQILVLLNKALILYRGKISFPKWKILVSFYLFFQKDFWMCATNCSNRINPNSNKNVKQQPFSVVILGSTGNGKSTFGNRLLGGKPNEFFKESDGLDSETMKTISDTKHWFSNDKLYQSRLQILLVWKIHKTSCETYPGHGGCDQIKKSQCICTGP